ncbi:MAG: peptidyl-dipeptidase Dcp [Gemmatimonadota bacterium]|nr:peptidyl-dipeptidase Dcp [Gemmatimonadota bacterium]
MAGFRSLVLSASCLAIAAAPIAAQTTAAENPLLIKSTLPFEAPPFDKIKDSDFQPAIDEGMRQSLAEVTKIADQTSAPTFENTIVALERSGTLLRRVEQVFSGLAESNTNPAIQRARREEAPKLAAHSDAINLNAKLFARIKAVYDHRKTSALNVEKQYLVERYYIRFVRAGANLAEPDKVKLRALNQEESTLRNAFSSKLLAATKAGALVLDSTAELAGFGAEEVAAAAQAAEGRGLNGKWVLPMQNTTQQPAQASLSSRAVRERLFNASITRAERGDSNDTRATVTRIAQIRAERAKVLGYPDYAAYVLENQMAKTPAAALKLLTGLVPAATAKARGEGADMQKLIDKENGGFTLAPWDWQYYSERVRKASYDLDESQLKPYFELNRVLQDGVFFAANKLYGITFTERKDIPVYQPDVRVFEVRDSNGKPMALFYYDPFKRDNKAGGAWTSSFVSQSGLLGTKPVMYNVENFTKPAPGQPALLTFGDVTTMFHEFGHALHGMFSNVEYPTVAGTSVPRDFVEFPSQFNEHWALEATVFANYAKHYKTGAPMPQELVQKIRRARTFNQGFATTEYLSASLLDLAWHTLPPDAPLQNVDTFEEQSLERFKVDLRDVPPRYRSSYFSHIWDNGYAAGYYAYLWSEVLDDDAYAWFTEHGGMTRANGQRFRDMILSRGNTEDVGAMYRAFRGRDPRIEPLLEQRGLTEKPVAK